MNKIGDSLQHTGVNQKIIRAFLDNEVEFVVVGGLAVAWYCSSRQADDMDLLVNPSHENSERIFSALTGLGMTGFSIGSFAKIGLQVPIKHIYYADLLTPQNDGQTYSEIEAEAVAAKLFNIPVRVASIGSLIRMKERALEEEAENQDKHRRDIQMLRNFEIEA